MTDRYNLTNLTTNYDFMSSMTIINEKAGHSIGIGILIAVFLLVFLGLKRYESKRAFAASTFITTIISVLLASIGWVNLAIAVICIIAAAGSALMLILEEG